MYSLRHWPEQTIKKVVAKMQEMSRDPSSCGWVELCFVSNNVYYGNKYIQWIAKNSNTKKKVKKERYANIVNYSFWLQIQYYIYVLFSDWKY